MRNHRRSLCALIATIGLSGASSVPAAEPPLAAEASIALAGVEGRIDHMAYDPALKRLYVAALGNNTVEILDTAAGKRLGTIKGLKKPQGVAALPDSTLAVASGGDGMLRFYDADQKLLGSIANIDDADNVRYDAAAKRLYVGYGDGALAIIDPGTRTKLGDIALKAHPESFQLEPEGPRIYVNVPGHGVAVADRDKRSTLATWPLPRHQANFAMALDSASGHLFVATRKPPALLALSTRDGSVLATADAAADADDVFYDPPSGRLYVTGGDGTITVLAFADNRLTTVATIKTAAGARTSLFADGKLFVAVPARGTQKAEIRVFRPAKRS